jgi:hypothetical protein
MKLITIILTLASLTFTAFANSYQYKPLPIPNAAEIAAFSNGLPPATGKRTTLTREDLARYLTKGRNNTDPSTWPARVTEFNRNSPCDGVFVDKAGKVFFWIKSSANGIRLETAEGEQAYLEVED